MHCLLQFVSFFDKLVSSLTVLLNKVCGLRSTLQQEHKYFCILLLRHAMGFQDWFATEILIYNSEILIYNSLQSVCNRKT